MTPEALQDALIADLTAALAGRAYPAEDGSSRPIRLFAQDLPPITGFDEQGREADSQQPYLIVRLEEGEIPNEDSPQEITVMLVISMYNPSPDRQGHRDVLQVMGAVLERFGKNRVVKSAEDGGKLSSFTVTGPVNWAIQREETHPYYFGAVSMKFEAPGWCQEVPYL